MSDTIWRFEWPADKPNPFRLLGLPTSATNEDIVESGKDLCDEGSRDEALLYRWAMEQLITHPLTRFAYEWTEVPGAQYEDDEWDRFERANRKAPVDASALARDSQPPSLGDFRLNELISLLLDGLLKVDSPPLGPAIENNPFCPDCGPPPLEVSDVIFG